MGVNALLGRPGPSLRSHAPSPVGRVLPEADALPGDATGMRAAVVDVRGAASASGRTPAVRPAPCGSSARRRAPASLKPTRACSAGTSRSSNRRLISTIASGGRCRKNGSLLMILSRYSREQTAGSTHSSLTGDLGLGMFACYHKSSVKLLVSIVSPHMEKPHLPLPGLWARLHNRKGFLQ